MADTDVPIFVTIIGGYLGSGKTTLINHLLKVGTGRTTAVIVNDFGELSIDEALIESDDGGVLALSNGCMCCSISSSVGDTLAMVAGWKSRPEWVLIETSGVSDPAQVAHFALAPGFALSAVVVMVDAVEVRRRAAHPLTRSTIERQLSAADLLIVNKSDRVDPEASADLSAYLDKASPLSHHVMATYGQVDPAIVLEHRTRHTRPVGHHDPKERAFTVHTEEVIDSQMLFDYLDQLSQGALRAKGFVKVESDRVLQVQLVGQSWVTHDVEVDRTVPLGLVIISLEEPPQAPWTRPPA